MNCIKIYNVILIILLTISASESLASVELSLEERKYLSQINELTFTTPQVEHNQFPKDIYSSGAAYEKLATSVAKLLNVKIRFKSYDTASDVLEAVAIGDVHFAVGYAETFERKIKLQFTQPVYEVQNVVWYSSNRYNGQAPNSLKWGCVEGGYFCSQIEDFGGTNVRLFEDYYDLYLALSKGAVDATIIDFNSTQAYYSTITPGEWLGDYTLLSNGFTFPVQIMSSRRDPILAQILAKTQRALDDSSVSGIKFSADRYHKSEVEKTLELRHNRQHIRYTIGDDIYPMSYRDASTGQVTGYIHDIIALIARKSGVEFLYVDPKDRKLTTLLEEGEVDFIPSVGDIFSKQMAKYIYTEPVLDLTWVVIQSKIPPSEFNQAILKLRDHSFYDKAIKTKFPNIQPYTDINRLIDNLAKGTISRGLLPRVTFEQYVINHHDEILAYVERVPEQDINFQVIFKFNSNAIFLRDYLNYQLSNLKQDEIKMIRGKYHTIVNQYGYNKDQVTIIMLSIFCVLLLGLLFYLLRVRKLKHSLNIFRLSEQHNVAQIVWFKSLIDLLPSKIVIHDEFGTRLLSNRAFDELCTSCTFKDDKDQCSIPLSPDCYGTWNNFSCQCGSETSYFRMRCEEIFDHNGEEKLVVTILDDMTDWNRQNEELELSNQKALDAIKARDRFLATVSHELRTPIAAMIGLMELLSSKIENSENIELLSNAMLSANRLKLLVNDILDLSKIEADQLRIYAQPGNVYDELSPLLRTFETNATQKDLAFVLDWTPSRFNIVKVDWLRVTQILQNLLSNALKFTSYGHVKVQIEATESTLNIIITDTGCGMDDHQLEQAFIPFSQADRSIAKNYGGTGLGITIVNSLVDMMAGSLSIESRLGIGTRVEVALPIQASSELVIDVKEVKTNNEKVAQWLSIWDQPGHHQIPASTYWISIADGNIYPDILQQKLMGINELLGKEGDKELGIAGQVLIADDDEINRLLFRKQLLKLGLNPILVCDGQEALDYLEHSYQSINVVITDYHMPNIDGFELAKRIRNSELYGHLPVIGCTAEDSKRVVERCNECQMEAIIYKPYSLDDLANVLKPYFEIQIRSDKDLLQWMNNYEEDELSHMASVVVESFTKERKLLSDNSGDHGRVVHRIKGSASLLGLQALVSHAKLYESSDLKDKNMHVLNIINELDKEIDVVKQWLVESPDENN